MVVSSCSKLCAALKCKAQQRFVRGFAQSPRLAWLRFVASPRRVPACVRRLRSQVAVRFFYNASMNLSLLRSAVTRAGFGAAPTSRAVEARRHEAIVTLLRD